MFVQLEYDVGCGKVGLQPYLFFVFRTQKKNQKVYARMYPSVHKNVLRRTQKCTQVYTKLYKGVHKKYIGRCIFRHYHIVIKPV